MVPYKLLMALHYACSLETTREENKTISVASVRNNCATEY
jgi:hypothetical protein